MRADEFYNKYKGKAIDTDGGYGVQCVDLFKQFTKDMWNIYNYNCTNGWASGLWIYRKDKPYYEKFIEVSLDEVQNGDWIFWNNGSKSCPNSHVAMSYNGSFFGQNQNGKHAASLAKYSTDGVLGVLRPKEYIKKKEDSTYTIGNYQTKGTMNVRSGAGLNYPIKKVKDITEDGKRNVINRSPNANAVYKRGTIFTAKEIINNSDGSIWARTPSGYVTIKGASGQVYSKRVN